MKQVHHYTASHYNRPSRLEIAVFGFVITLAAIMLGLLCLSGCAGPGVAQAAPTSGGRLTVERQYLPPATTLPKPATVTPIAAPSETLQFTQGDNANSPSTIETNSNGTMKVVFGTVEKPILAIVPAPDYTMYWCLAAGIVFLGGGIALACYGWPQIGLRLALAGLGMVVLALTVKNYGWAYVLGLGVLAAWIAWEKLHAYKIGVAQESLKPKQA